MANSAIVVPTDRSVAWSALDAVPACALIFDPAGNLIYANPAARSSLLDAFDSAQLFSSIIDPGTERALPPERTPLARALSGQVTEGAQFLLWRPREANPHWYECDASPLYSPMGGLQGAMITFRDVTERRRKERSSCFSTPSTGRAWDRGRANRCCLSLWRNERPSSAAAREASDALSL